MFENINKWSETNVQQNLETRIVLRQKFSPTVSDYVRVWICVCVCETINAMHNFLQRQTRTKLDLLQRRIDGKEKENITEGKQEKERYK